MDSSDEKVDIKLRVYDVRRFWNNLKVKRLEIRVITKLPNFEQSSRGKVKTHKYINRQKQSTNGKLGKP